MNGNNGTSFYFEIKIVKSGRNAEIVIGVTQADPNTRTGCLPGWDGGDYDENEYSTLGTGYHGDDGGIFYSSGDEHFDTVETFSTGDVVGCLIKVTIDEKIAVHFTKNGMKISSVPVLLEMAVWYPTIAFASPGAMVDTNFGEHPFLYMNTGKNRDN